MEVQKVAASSRTADRVTAEQIERARSVNLVSFLHQYQPGELKRVGQSWTLRSHDSMRISADGKWNWFSQSVGGGDAISYLQKVHGMTFQESIRTLAGEDYQALRVEEAAREPPPRKEFVLPPKNQNSRRAFAYLCSRGIDPEILNHCMRRGLIYEDARHHNAVFVGHDEKGRAQYAMLRSTVSNSSFKIEQAGSNKSFGFCMKGSGPTLYVCEAAIDALSVATLRKLGGRDWRKDSYLALGGVTASAEKLPPALERMLQSSSFNRIVLSLDNDEPGQRAARNIFALLRQRHPQIELKVCVPQEKDFNDQLRLKRQQNAQPPPSRVSRELAFTN